RAVGRQVARHGEGRRLVGAAREWQLRGLRRADPLQQRRRRGADFLPAVPGRLGERRRRSDQGDPTAALPLLDHQSEALSGRRTWRLQVRRFLLSRRSTPLARTSSKPRWATKPTSSLHDSREAAVALPSSATVQSLVTYGFRRDLSG